MNWSVIMKVLNLYAGIGGNRSLWPNSYDVTAVELDPDVAKVYAERFPNDKIVVGDAHQYLLEHFKEFDFIWASPPCPTHSRTNFFLKGKGVYRYPDMRLYQEVLFLKHFFKGRWCVENVISYYDPLIRPQKIGRHYFWANFNIPIIRTPNDDVGGMNGKYQKAREKDQGERDAVWSPLGAHILRAAEGKVQETLIKGSLNKKGD